MTRHSGWLAALTAALLVAPGAAAQVKSANPATAWVYAPNVTVNDLWRAVRDGQVQVVSSAAAADPKGGGVEHGPRVLHQPTCHHRPELYPGLSEAEAADLLRDFFRSRR